MSRTNVSDFYCKADPSSDFPTTTNSDGICQNENDDDHQGLLHHSYDDYDDYLCNDTVDFEPLMTIGTIDMKRTPCKEEDEEEFNNSQHCLESADYTTTTAPDETSVPPQPYYLKEEQDDTITSLASSSSHNQGPPLSNEYFVADAAEWQAYFSCKRSPTDNGADAWSSFGTYAPVLPPPISIFDMVELLVTCPALGGFCNGHLNRERMVCASKAMANSLVLQTYTRFSRRIGVHAGITLYNLHRVLCYCCEYSEELAERCLHVWRIPNAENIYANGRDFREEARKSKVLMTDKTVALCEFLPPEHWTIFQMEYSLGDLPFVITVSDLLIGQTAQQDLLWVPRLCENSEGSAPPPFLTNSDLITKKKATDVTGSKIENRGRRRARLRDDSYMASSTSSRIASFMNDELTSHQHLDETYDGYQRLLMAAAQQQPFRIDGVNRILSETRFGRNLAVSRKSKRTRISEESSRLIQFRLPVRLFFGEPFSRNMSLSVLPEKPKRKRRRKNISPQLPSGSAKLPFVGLSFYDNSLLSKEQSSSSQLLL